MPDDDARTADGDEHDVEGSLSDRFNRVFGRKILGRSEHADDPRELTDTIDRPAFQDPREKPEKVPDRYGTPLERPDGTRTPLFDGEPVREQAKQGRLNDCGIIAALGAVAGHRPEAIRDCVRETDDGNYEVRLHETRFSPSKRRYEPTGRSIVLTVTPELPVFDAKPHMPAFADSVETKAAWAPVLEKAIAGSDRTWHDERRAMENRLWEAKGKTGEPPTGYVRLNQGSKPRDRAELLTQLTGRPARSVEFPEYDSQGRTPDKQLLEDFRRRLADRKPVLVGTRDKRPDESFLPNNLADGHAYEVTKVDERGMIHLRNPWNAHHPRPMGIRDFKAYFKPRYITLE
ncbi:MULTISPECIES: C2 family cysteine protease [Actinomadura]